MYSVFPITCNYIVFVNVLWSYCYNTITSSDVSTTQLGYTPLISAAKCDVVIELLDDGGDINAQSNVSHINIVIHVSLSKTLMCMLTISLLRPPSVIG